MTFGIAIDDVTRLIRRVAEQEVLPRFRRLAQHDIREKSPGNLVTIADTEAELALTQGLTQLLPGSLVVGEEAVAADPTVLDRLAGDAPVWVIDPVDGTINFAKSVPRFAVMVALVAADDLCAGWIHDPIRNVTVFATAGGGAWRMDTVGRTRLQRGPMPPLLQSRGSAGGRVGSRGRALDILQASAHVGPLHRVSCAGLEYVDMVEGKLDYAVFSRTLPWDHSAGVLIHREAGGTSGYAEENSAVPAPYSPRRQAGVLLHAPTPAAWSDLRHILWAK